MRQRSDGWLLPLACDRAGSALASGSVPIVLRKSVLEEVELKSAQSYAFKSRLVGFPGVERTIELRGDQTLVDLHEALFDAFGWWEEHLFAFWLSGEFWGRKQYVHPFSLEHDPLASYREGPRAKTADVRIDRLKLEHGQRLAYVFDFGDEWRVELKLIRISAADDRCYPRIAERQGESPPQYPETEEEAAA